MGKWRYGTIILDLCARRRRVVSFMPLPLYPRRKCPGTSWIEDWVSPRAGLDPVEHRIISFSCRESNPCRPARRYTGLHWTGGTDDNYETLLTVATSLPAFQQCSPRSKSSLHLHGPSLASNTVVVAAGDWAQLMWKAANGDDPVPAAAISDRHNVSSYDMFNVILPSPSRSWKWQSSNRLPQQN
jgi:hypothetical protein